MYEPYLDVIRRWMTAEELEQVRKSLGSADEIIEQTSQVRRIIEKAEQREAIWQFLKMVGLAFVTGVGVLATIKAVLPSGWWP